MSTAFQRGMVLVGQGRYDLADGAFREELATDPENPLAHAFLSLCLSQRDREAEALREADEAVRTGPDFAFCHYVRGRALNALDRHDEAEAAAIEAIRLDPDDADYPALLASVAIARRRWSDALDAADRGLALDPENASCRNLRAMALVQLGRKDEAAQTLGSALADDPENAYTHANQGWALLHRGDHAGALVHFREALRLDPDLDWARAGIVEALKAQYVIYRWMLAYFLWMGRQSQRAQWAVILGFVFGRRILASVAQTSPALKPFIVPILFLSAAFLLMTWISSPLFNLALRFNRFGRMALSREQKVESSWIGASFFLAIGSLIAYVATGADLAVIGMIYFGLMLLPLAMTFQQPRGKPRLLAGAYATALGLAGGAAFAMAALDMPGPLLGVATFGQLIGFFAVGTMLATWIPAITSGMRP